MNSYKLRIYICVAYSTMTHLNRHYVMSNNYTYIHTHTHIIGTHTIHVRIDKDKTDYIHNSEHTYMKRQTYLKSLHVFNYKYKHVYIYIYIYTHTHTCIHKCSDEEKGAGRG